MTGNDSFPVSAQWALQGKTLGRDGYRVLASSAGSLSMENFTDAIGRFSMGTPEKLSNALPQMTISFLKSGEVNHLALAIHRLASETYPDGQLTASDDDGRAVVATSYYCVRYDPLAERSVSYQSMYEAFSAAPLRPENGPVLPVKLPTAPTAPDSGAINSLVIRAAALLVTGRPVCVLGASLQTNMTDRLGFIDTVMSLLPYGFRARMAAATWTRATNQNHHFRLFFSGDRRDVKDPDNVVFWGLPEQTIPGRNDTYAHYYFNWLNTGSVTDKLTLLAGLKTPRSLANRGQVQEALDEIDQITPFWPRRVPVFQPKTETEPARPENGQRPTLDTTVPAQSEVEQLLVSCARCMDGADSRRFGDTVGQLKMLTRSGVDAGERDRCRKLIYECHLFRHNDALGQDEQELREILLKIAFEPPLSYEDYCLIEDGIGEGKSPDPSLLQLIDTLIDTQGAADERVKAITYAQFPAGDAWKKLSKWYESAELSAYQLTNLLAFEVRHSRHMRLLCDVTTACLTRKTNTYDPKKLDSVLHRHRYLAGKLQDSGAGDDQYQLDTLGTFLRAAYPGGLTRDDLYHVMRGTKPVTLPFLGAVLLMVAKDDACLARDLYLHHSFKAMHFQEQTLRELLKLIDIPEGPAPSPQVEEALLFDRTVSAPLSPHHDLPGDPIRPLTTGGPAAPTDGQPDGASLSVPQDNRQQSGPGRHRGRRGQNKNDGQ